MIITLSETQDEALYDTQTAGGRGRLRQADCERSLQALMTTNLLKRLESSVKAFRLTLRALSSSIRETLDAIERFEVSSGAQPDVSIAVVLDTDVPRHRCR